MADISTAEELTARQYKALAALVSEPNIRRAAEASGVPERTLYTWLKDPLFDAEYRVMRRDGVRQATARLQHASAAAVSVLCQLMAKDTTHPSIRLAAASKILDLAIRAVELEDFADRLAAMERAIGNRKDV
jgi:hypothetical protein